jgi:serine/threonine protein kinase
MSTNIQKLSHNKLTKSNIKSQLRFINDYIDDLDNLCNISKFQVIHKIQCYLQSQLEKYNSSPSLISEPSKDFPQIILNYKELGIKSKQGVVFQVKLKVPSLKTVYAILKYGKGYHRTMETVLHEIYVGFVLNHLRETGNINFMYAYAPFYCSTGKELCATSSKSKVTTCGFFEYVPGVTLSDFIKKYINRDEDATIELFVKLFFQVALALCDAQNWCKFIHYDLHDENILIKFNPTPIEIIYKYAGYKLTNVDYSITIIDYGNSIIENKNKVVLETNDDSISDSNSHFLTPFTDTKVKVKYFEELAYTKEPYIGCYDIFHLAMMCFTSMSLNETLSKTTLQKVWKILMTFFIIRLESVKVSEKCKRFLNAQTFEYDDLYYRLQIADKEIVNISIQNYIEYLNSVLQLNTLKTL